MTPRTIRTAPALAALAATAMLVTAIPAQAGTEVSVTPNGIGSNPIEVISEDGKSWTKIKDQDVGLSITIGIGRTDESVLSYIVRQPGQPGTYLNSYLLSNNFNDNPVARVDENLNVVGSTTHFTAAERKQILDGCNANLGTGNGINQTHDMFHSAKVQLVGFFTGGNPGQINLGGTPGHIGNGNAIVSISCKGVMTRPGGLVAEEPKNLSVGSIELFRTTYANATTQPNPATVCKKARWLVRLNTNKAGPVKFKLWLKNGDAPMTSKVVDAWSVFDGAGLFKAEYAEWTEVTKTSVVQGMAEDMTNPIGQSTGWKDITLHCTGAGGGGLADVPDTNNPDNGTLPNSLKITGELTLADKAGAPKDKPRLGQAVFKIWPNKPGNTSYRLTCTGGREWEGTLQTFKVGNNKYQAVGAHNFQIDKTELIGCALRSTSLPNNDVIALASKQFELVKRNPDVSAGADGLTTAPIPPNGSSVPGRPAIVVTPKPPLLPGIKVAPLPQISCAGGNVANNNCVCPVRTRKVQAGANAYRCVQIAAEPKTLVGPVVRKPVTTNAPPAQSSVPNRAVVKTAPRLKLR